jgi:hypothetical protein
MMNPFDFRARTSSRIERASSRSRNSRHIAPVSTCSPGGRIRASQS